MDAEIRFRVLGPLSARRRPGFAPLTRAGPKRAATALPKPARGLDVEQVTVVPPEGTVPIVGGVRFSLKIGSAMITASIMMGRALAPIETAIANWRAFVAARQSIARLSEAPRPRITDCNNSRSTFDMLPKGPATSLKRPTAAI